MHGLGNDFVVIDGRKFRLPNLPKAAKRLCDRRFGVGADQLLILTRSHRADFGMEIYNADGSRVEMCGNGIRCVVQYARDEKIVSRSEVSVETPAGVQKIKILPKNLFTVDMGEPILRGREIPVRLAGRVINRPIRVDGMVYRVTCVSMGNPHCVTMVENLEKLAIEKIGPMIENHPVFPKKANVEFIKILSPKVIEMRVWERGTGETLACGSGACAAAVAGALNQLTERKVEVKLRGGSLQIEWRKKDGHVLITGPAETVFRGEVEI